MPNDFTATSSQQGQSAQPAVSVHNLTKSFGDNVALDQVGLSIDSGEMVALVGASGSGKSTLLRAVNGLQIADQGRVEIFGTSLQTDGKLHSNVRRLRSRIGFIFQQFNLVNRLSVLENVLIGSLSEMSALRAGLRLFSQEEKAQALAALERVGILNQAYKRAAFLSGGQQQRVAIARCLMQGAQIILADEPIASLDPESARKVMQLLTDLSREQGLTVITCLHQVQMVRHYFSRSIALRDGAVHFDGLTHDLNDERLNHIYGAAAEELVLSGHAEAIA
ncbi:phosphonate ABC transporter ATP-binding protein [Romeria aff. gracilis LEGE 07310]|uniref:Phosphonate ABC transporter ATP-binding protein n=1 Tax=Vasconcelosia minhoensis LEGE 07310 TaxID=915328 RepID=A0A8J7DN33_9CYAN|nr:phosphonate ABC transporter ATP-binding protein [Romeria gracilis]MBE9079716.1 phosphonate ABC transporter ATP-binding protein [Romeria aff. gracilis LEGE 07310]